MKKQRVGILNSSDSESVHSLLQSSLPTMVIAPETSSCENTSVVGSSADTSQVLDGLDNSTNFSAKDETAESSFAAAEVPEGEVVGDSYSSLSLYAAQMQKEFESCLLSLNCDGE